VRILRITISQVAKLAGVSKATVSRTLNNSGYVSEETRKRIQEVIKKYGYTPDSKAINLSKKMTSTVELVLPDTVGPFYNEVIRGVEEILSARGYFTLLTILDTKKERNQARNRYISAILERRVDAAIIFDPTVDKRTFSKIAAVGIPIVSLLKDYQNHGVDSVVVDNFSGASSMIDHLVTEHGYKNIAFVTGPKESSDSEDRLIGYKETLKKHGLSFKNSLIFESDFTFDGGKRVYQQLRPVLRDIQAVFCANDEMALAIMEEMKKEGIVPGKDIAVVGFDDVFWSEYIAPPLTTVHQPMYDLGKISAQRIVSRLFDHESKPIKVVLQTHLVIRKSCGCH